MLLPGFVLLVDEILGVHLVVVFRWLQGQAVPFWHRVEDDLQVQVALASQDFFEEELQLCRQFCQLIS